MVKLIHLLTVLASISKLYTFCRLQDVSEVSVSQNPFRRRSNSLPIPEIEVSFYQSPETKKRENKDFIEVPEAKDMNILAGKWKL